MSLTGIQDRIAGAVAGAGRPVGSVTLVAVSKVQPEDRVRAVLGAGHRTPDLGGSLGTREVGDLVLAQLGG